METVPSMCYVQREMNRRYSWHDAGRWIEEGNGASIDLVMGGDSSIDQGEKKKTGKKKAPGTRIELVAFGYSY